MRYLLIIIGLVSNGCFIFGQTFPTREFRGVWIATGKNIDYPSNKNLSVKEQKSEFISLVNLLKSNGINAVLLQIRPACDAFYESKYEPWSEWLTGVQGKAPEPYYDPLKFMIEETHKRGMEFHAWFNPYRAVFTIQYANVSKENISVKKPEWCFTYGLHKYLNPGIPEVREYIIKVIMDVVERYDIDGVHFDDYFYPYPEYDDNKKIISIPDYSTFTKYKGNFTSIEDWRRNNVNVFIKELNIAIKAKKPFIKFGIGPPGIWRNKSVDPKGSDTRGFASYDYMYADVLTWLREGWIDYVSPQVYWTFENPAADYKKVVEWWNENSFGKHVYIGIALYNSIKPTGKWDNPSEIPTQIKFNRKLPNIQGSILYSSRVFKSNPFGINDSLRKRLFNDTVLYPAMKWLDSVGPEPPKGIKKRKIGDEFHISWEKENTKGKAVNDTTVFYTVYKFKGKNIGQLGTLENRILVTKQPEFIIDRNKKRVLFGKKYVFVVTAWDKMHNEGDPSSPILIKFPRKQ